MIGMIAMTDSKRKVASVHLHLSRPAGSNEPFTRTAIVFFDDGTYCRTFGSVYDDLADRANDDDFRDGNYIEFSQSIAWSEVAQ